MNDVNKVIRWVRDSFRVQPLAVYDYPLAIQMVSEAGLTGGAIYDALHVRAAVKAEADRIASGDKRSFPYLWPNSKLVNPFEA